MRAVPAPEQVAAIRRALLAFYDARARTLPWRSDRNAYRVWVSEIMLQQTRVETVIPYYERWLARFPTIEALADAHVDDVLHTWQGLGYYSRARNLHAAARIVRERHAGRIPEDTGSLRALPGVGEYTAGAIASIAYDRAEAAVDGNVRRVLARVFDEAEPAPAWLRAVAGRLVPTDRPGDFNQAMMELGALVCVSRAPRCGVCPLRDHCVACARGTQYDRPARKPPAAVPHFDVGTAVVRDARGRLLLTRRADTGLLAGLWQFPGEIVQPGAAGVLERTADAAARAAGTAIALAGAGDRTVSPPGTGRAAGARSACELPDGALHREDGVPTTVEHVFSHRRESYHVHTFRWAGAVAPEPAREARPGAAPGPAAAAWYGAAELAALAMPAAQRRIAALAVS